MRRCGLVASLVGLLALPASGAEELLVGAAVSLREPLTEIAGRHEATHPGERVQLLLGASSFIATQIRAGAPIDVFVSADDRIVDELVAEGWIAAEGSGPVARNRLVVLQARGERAPIRRAEDLAGPGVRRIAVPDGAVPVGRYARAWLEGRGLLAALEERLVRTEHARATLAAVDLGHVDVAVVYATDARLARSARLAFEVPESEQPRIVYAAGRVGGPDGAADRLLAFLRGPEARAVLAAAGFGAP